MACKDWIEAFTIFQKYESNGYQDVAAEHDEMWAGPDPAVVSDEDKMRLDELGWRPDNDGGFHRFV